MAMSRVEKILAIIRHALPSGSNAIVKSDGDPGYPVCGYRITRLNGPQVQRAEPDRKRWYYLSEIVGTDDLRVEIRSIILKQDSDCAVEQ